ncbi:hypothetical protein [Roseimaritima sediminicola]|uniref:hypothetical protein n=1 Tax=Roseimaritima sediminicola TaxID=2662066 RepID=UPI001F362BC2|nr:hypothetical protein [Roseimaritima sediminicola]
MNAPTASMAAANDALEQLTMQLNRYQRSIRLAIEAYLHSMAGQSFGSLSENRRFVKSVHALLDGHGLRVRCPECGHPAILRCSPGGPEGHGQFAFDHYIQGRRTFHGGGSRVPKVLVIAKPARRRANA